MRVSFHFRHFVRDSAFPFPFERIVKCFFPFFKFLIHVPALSRPVKKLSGVYETELGIQIQEANSLIEQLNAYILC